MKRSPSAGFVGPAPGSTITPQQSALPSARSPQVCTPPELMAVNHSPVGVAVGAGAFSGVGVAVGGGALVGVGVAVGIGALAGAGVSVGMGVAVGAGAFVGTSVAVGVKVSAGAGVAVGTIVGADALTDCGAAAPGSAALSHANTNRSNPIVAVIMQ